MDQKIAADILFHLNRLSAKIPTDTEEILAHAHGTSVYVVIKRAGEQWWGCVGLALLEEMFKGNQQCGPISRETVDDWLGALTGGALKLENFFNIPLKLKDKKDHRCTCGAIACGFNSHSHWCDLIN